VSDHLEIFCEGSHTHRLWDSKVSTKCLYPTGEIEGMEGEGKIACADNVFSLTFKATNERLYVRSFDPSMNFLNYEKSVLWFLCQA